MQTTGIRSRRTARALGPIVDHHDSAVAGPAFQAVAGQRHFRRFGQGWRAGGEVPVAILRAYSATPSARTASQETVTGKTRATCCERRGEGVDFMAVCRGISWIAESGPRLQRTVSVYCMSLPIL